jgi:hypothetical protein
MNNGKIKNNTEKNDVPVIPLQPYYEVSSSIIGSFIK